MFNKLKILGAAAAFSVLPMLASAAPLLFNQGVGNPTLIELGNTYSYGETNIITGPSSRTFELEVTPPQQVVLMTQLNTLEFTGDFVGLVVTLTNNMGAMVINPFFTNSSTRLYDLDTVFNAGNGFEQSVSVAWDDVVGGSNSQAGLQMQGIPSAIPVPAAGLLLLTAVGGAAALRRRKKAA